jgi:predicted heme/steroid binding protein
MNYDNVCTSAAIAMVSGIVPYIEGHAGTGKSTMWNDGLNGKQMGEGAELVQKFYEKKKGIKPTIKTFTIFGSLLKEGELGGIPIPQKVKAERLLRPLAKKNAETEEEFEPELVKLNKRFRREFKASIVNQNTYTIYKKLLDLSVFCMDDNALAILFIDEVNRCDPAVQQELMQLILEKRINDTILPKNCMIVAAGNPDGFDYQVLTMNTALESRMCLLNLDSEASSWLHWATMAGLHEDVLGFIAEFPHMLHQPKTTDRVKANPRSWEFMSKILNNMGDLSQDDYITQLINIGTGVVGTDTTSSFLGYLNSKDNPLITTEEVFESSEKDFKEVLERLDRDSNMRIGIIIDKLIMWMDEHKDLVKKDEKYRNRYTQCLKVIPKDMMMSYLLSLTRRDDNKELHKIIATKNDAYMELYFEVVEKTKQTS